MSCIRKVIIHGSEDILQYAFPLPNEDRTPNEIVTYTSIVDARFSAVTYT